MSLINKALVSKKKYFILECLKKKGITIGIAKGIKEEELVFILGIYGILEEKNCNMYRNACFARYPGIKRINILYFF